MSSKFTDFDPLSALFRDFSDSDQDVPEPLRFTQDNHQSDENDEVTTQIIPLDADLVDDDSDEDIVEPLVVSNTPPILSPSSGEEDDTEQIIMKRNMPPKNKVPSASSANKSTLATETTTTDLHNHEIGEPQQKSIEAETGISEKNTAELGWKRFSRPKTALEMALELAAEEDGVSTSSDALQSSEDRDVVEEQIADRNSTVAGQNVEDTDEGDETDENVLLRDHVSSILQPIFPNLENYSVVRAIYADDRKLFQVLWKSHRSKFILEGRLEYAIATLSVINALKTAPKNDLVAAHLETSATDYLVWIRPSNGDVLAAFQDARQYFS